MYHYNKLRGRIVEKYGTQEVFADVLGIGANTLSLKMTGKIGFSQSDIEKWAALLDIEKSEYPDYFFT